MHPLTVLCTGQHSKCIFCNSMPENLRKRQRTWTSAWYLQTIQQSNTVDAGLHLQPVAVVHIVGPTQLEPHLVTLPWRSVSVTSTPCTCVRTRWCGRAGFKPRTLRRLRSIDTNLRVLEDVCVLGNVGSKLPQKTGWHLCLKSTPTTAFVTSPSSCSWNARLLTVGCFATLPGVGQGWASFLGHLSSAHPPRPCSSQWLSSHPCEHCLQCARELGRALGFLLLTARTHPFCCPCRALP